ncbi:MAG: 16S rRNA (guanine(966)-N(2))-methyltransferase RsmD [Myxococcales bacterium]|nr:16S rRNA (guanine(966)-N(2))-methyltransferase RsmD [Myxococcales bacterium]
MDHVQARSSRLSVRIIGGEFRGRPLRTPAGLTTRPTAARVREALFDILGDISGSNVADLCAGSGALGIEALSRGARHASFVDPDRGALDAIRHNLETLRVSERATLLPLRVERARKALLRQAPFDLVLCDPPWPIAERVAETLGELLDRELLNSKAIVVIGHRGDRPLRSAPPSQLVPGQRRVWGDSGLSWFAPRPSTDTTMAP